MSLIHWWPLKGNLRDYISGNNLEYYSGQNNGKLVSGSDSGPLGYYYNRTEIGYNDLFRSKSKLKTFTSCSIACWAYVHTIADPNSANGLVTNHDHTTSSGLGITVKCVSSTDFRMSVNTGRGGGSSDRTYNSYYGTTNIRNGWHHLCVTYGKNTVKLYVNGVLEKTVSSYAQYFKSDYFDVFSWSTGHYTSTSYRPGARLCDIRVYDHELSKKEIMEIYKTKLIDLNFDVITHASAVNDESGYGNNATAVAMVNRGIGSNIGEKAAVFDGTNSYLEFPSFKYNLLTSDFTIEFSINPAESGVRDVIFGDYGLSGAAGFNIERNSGSYTDNRIRIYANNGGYDKSSTKCILPANTWTHVALVYTKAAKTMKVYKNGELVDTITDIDITSNKSVGSTYPWRIGADSRTTNVRFNGKISLFRIYGTALSDNSVAESYKTRIQVARNGSLFTHKINEDGVDKSVVFDYKMNANSNSASEVYIPYDNELYYEDDGSMWVRLFHHNNPASTKFSTSDSFTTKVWKSTNQWFNLAFCNNTDKWELMIKQKQTSTSTEKKFRWIQKKNPMTAVYGDVDRADITPITSLSKVGRIPHIYQEVDYVQNTARQCINTKYAFKTDNTKIDADIMIVTNSANQSLWGNEENVTAGGRYFSAVPHGINGSFGLYLGSHAPKASGLSIPVGTRYNVVFESNKTGSTNNFTFKRDSTVLASGTYSGSMNTADNINKTSTASTTIGHFFIFANHNSGGGSSNASTQEVGAMRVYGFKIYDDGVLVRDYVPCYRKSDNVVGLFDLVTREFFTDYNGGNLTKGSNVSATYDSTSYGGLYKLNSANTFLAANNGTSGNWWGAVGAFAEHGGGIPGWNGEVVTSGYMDVYLRVDNVNLDISSLTDTNFKSYSNGEIYSPNIYEY